MPSPGRSHAIRLSVLLLLPLLLVAQSRAYSPRGAGGVAAAGQFALRPPTRPTRRRVVVVVGPRSRNPARLRSIEPYFLLYAT